MRALVLSLGILALAALPAPARQKKGGAPGVGKAPDLPLVKLAPQAKGKPPRALKYRLLPDPLDAVPGNAALLWLRAGRLGLAVRHKVSDREYSWSGSEVSLAKLPRREVRDFLARYAGPLRLAEQAALRKTCDWGWPPVTVQALQDPLFLPLDDIQSLRHLAFLLSVRCRLELAEGRFDSALRTLQTGLTLARHTAHSDTLIQDLVGIAIATIMLGRVEEWVQVPGSPNLYWALTTLPRPFIDVRSSLTSELGTLYRSFPQLREVRKGKMTNAQAQALADQLLTNLKGLCPTPAPAWMGRLGLATLTAKYYPDAKKYLRKQGYADKEIDAMPAVQVVLVAFCDDWERAGDDILKWLSVPAWQGRAGIEKVAKEARSGGRGGANPFMRLLVPAIAKVYEAQLRLDRHLAGLRCAEALRWHAAAHGGKAPAKWEDITEVPRPVDPATGKGFDAFYKVEGGKANLAIPAPGVHPSLGRRYEWAVKGGEKE
jgi:hypothetical protein